MVDHSTRIPNMVLTQKSWKAPKVLFSKPLQNWRKPWLCVGWKRTLLLRSLIVKSQQNKFELVTRPEDYLWRRRAIQFRSENEFGALFPLLHLGEVGCHSWNDLDNLQTRYRVHFSSTWRICKDLKLLWDTHLEDTGVLRLANHVSSFHLDLKEKTNGVFKNISMQYSPFNIYLVTRDLPGDA